MNSSLRYFLLSLFVIIADQASKYWAHARLREGAEINIINGLFKFSYTENTGIAFGIFADSSGAVKVWALAAVSLIALAVVIYFAIKTPANKRLLLVALMLVHGGIAGNLIDRIHLHAVIDFIELYIGDYHWPTFNLADAAICIGAVLLSVDILMEPREAVAATPPTHPEDQPKEGAGD